MICLNLHYTSTLFLSLLDQKCCEDSISVGQCCCVTVHRCAHIRFQNVRLSDRECSSSRWYDGAAGVAVNATNGECRRRISSDWRDFVVAQRALCEQIASTGVWGSETRSTWTDSGGRLMVLCTSASRWHMELTQNKQSVARVEAAMEALRMLDNVVRWD